RAEAVFPDRLVIVTGIARAAGDERQFRSSGVCDTMSRASGNVMHAAGRHRLGPRLAGCIHENQRALSAHGRVEFRAIASRVKVAVGYEIFVTDLAGFED